MSDPYTITPAMILASYRYTTLQREAIRRKDKSYMTEVQAEAIGKQEDKDTAREILLLLQIPPKSTFVNSKDEKVAAYADGYNQAINEIEQLRDKLL